MSDLAIKIGDDYLDLSSDQSIAITKQAAKVGDFSKVLADGTNEVRVPATAHNIATLENAQLMQSESEKPYRRNNATLIQEGYETLQDGFAIVKSFSKDFSLQLVGGNASFFNLIKDLNLRDLDLSEFDHFWTNQNVFDNRNNTSGFVYALFEQSDDSASPTLSTYGTNLYAVQTELLLPLFYDKDLISRIFSNQSGWTFDTDVISEFIYTHSTCFAASTPDRHGLTYYLDLSTVVDTDTNLQFNDVGGIPIPIPLLPNASIVSQGSNYYDEATLNDLLINGFSIPLADGSKILFPDSVRATITFNLTVENPNATGTVTLECDCVYTTEEGEQTVIVNNVLAFGTNNLTISFEVDISKLETATTIFSAGENGAWLSIGVLHDTLGLSDSVLKAGSTGTYSYEFLQSYPISPYLPYNYLLGVTPVPDMLQGEYLKDVAKKMQFIYDTNEITHTVTARRFDEIKEREFEAVDFSDILHDDRQEIEFGISGYAQTNLLKWKPDDTTGYTGEGQILVDDQTLEAERTIVEMAQFAATSTRLRFDTVNSPYVPLFETGFPTNNMTDRMLLVKPVTFPYNINFNRSTETPTDLPTYDVSFAYFSEPGNPDSLDFPNLIDRFYQTIISMNDKAKSLSCFLNLKIKDVVNYDPFIPVYIAKYSQYFYWEKLENYVKNRLTRCKLIKL